MQKENWISVFVDNNTKVISNVAVNFVNQIYQQKFSY